MWPYAYVVAPSAAIVSTGIVLVQQGAIHTGSALIGIGSLILLVAFSKFRLERDDRAHGFYRILGDGDVKCLFTYPEFRRLPQRIRTELMGVAAVDRWVQDEITRRATNYLRSPRLSSAMMKFREFFD